MVATNGNNVSIRSLTSLQLVPPPQKQSQGANDTHDIKGELEKWDPFPAPYAPHAALHHRQPKDETRDEREQESCRRSASDDEPRDGAQESPMREVEFARRTPKAKNPSRAGASTRTPPPKIPYYPGQQQAEALAAYYDSSNRSASRSRSSSTSSSNKTELIKITANGSVTGQNSRPGGNSSSITRSSSRTTRSDRSEEILSPIKMPSTNEAANHFPDTRPPSSKKKKLRSCSPIPMLTRGRVDLHVKTQSQNDKKATMNTPDKPSKNQGGGTTNGNVLPSSIKSDKSSLTPKPKPSTSSSTSTNPKVFMIGTAKVYSRALTPPTVYHNTVTDLWIVTINTNSKLANPIGNPNSNSTSNSNSSNNNFTVKAFSFRTEKEARASAYANAPPIMIPFDSCHECMLCNTKFTLFKRPRHCRNCGICICSNYDCCTVWSKKMIPETFNIKKESTVKVCTSCHALTKRFRHALLQGRYGSAVEMYLTGNINLRVPFAFKKQEKKKESMFPIHCAIEGQSEKLVRWLVDVQHCPLHVLSTGNTNRSSGGGGVTSSVMGAGADMIKSLNETLGSGNGNSSAESKHDFVPTLKTSKGRSVIDIAMKTQHVGILRYLIHEKNVSVYEVEDLELALGSVEALVKAFPCVDGSYDPTLFMDNKQLKNGGSGGTNSAEERKSDSGSGGITRGSGRNKPATERVATATKSANKARQGRSNTAGISPKKERIYSHSVVESFPKEKMFLPRDIHGVQNEGSGLYGAIGGYNGNNDDVDDDSDDDHDDDDHGNNEEEHDTIVLEDDNSVSTTVPDICILCHEKDVDCVATPCGHQMCCLTCSNQCLRCPICNLECHFIEIYQP